MVDILSRCSRLNLNLSERCKAESSTNTTRLDRTDIVGSPQPAPSQRRKPRRFTDTELDELVAAYQDGERVIDIAARLDVHRGTVIRQLRARGVPTYTGWTEETTIEAVRLYEQGLSVADVAARMGRAPSTVWWHISTATEMRARWFK